MKIVILDYATIENGDLLPLNEISAHITTFDNTHQSQLVERCDGFDEVITNKVVINQDALSKLKTEKYL